MQTNNRIFQMNSFLITVAGIIAFTAGSFSAHAADITSDEQIQTRSVTQNIPIGNRETYCSLMKNRIQSMSSEEREQFGKIMVTPVEKKIVMVRVLATDPAVGLTTVKTLPAINNNMWLSRICSKGTEKTSVRATSFAPGHIYSI